MRTTLSCAIAMVGAVDASMAKPVRTDRRVNMAINLRILLVKFHGAPASAHTSADAQNANSDCMEARRKHPRRRVEIEQDFGTSRWGGFSLEPISVGRRCERG